jgi:hypothetical protein
MSCFDGMRIRSVEAPSLWMSFVVCAMAGGLGAGTTDASDAGPEHGFANTIQRASSPVRCSEVVFMYVASDQTYRAYDATFVGWSGADTAASGLVTVRQKSGANQVVLHVLNRDYDPQSKSMRPLLNMEVSVEKALVTPAKPQARLLSYDQPPQWAELEPDANRISVRIPELRLWMLAGLE